MQYLDFEKARRVQFFIIGMIFVLLGFAFQSLLLTFVGFVAFAIRH